MQELETSSSESPNRRRRFRRRVVQAGIAVIVLAVLALVPPLITVNRLQRRIAGSISESLGRPVHLDRVTLNILPWPGFTLQNLVIDDDPAFGSEPVIRANTVTAELRLSSLWRRQVEFSKIGFGVDGNGSGPSVNLVRNDQGKWNLESILIQASRVNAAPTTQRTAGPAPRFPLIDATGARVNVKRSSEKLPFSLIDAEFGLSLSNPQQWKLRLEGRPVRTDTNATDTGVVRIEGTLNRAPSFSDVPVDLTATWEKVPLGEATRVVTGSDAGWRGDLTLTVHATGTLGATLLAARAQAADLHRADFSPRRMLQIDLRCNAKTSFLTRALAGIECLLPLDPTTGRQILLTGELPDVHRPGTASWKIDFSKVPAAWSLDWARLFSQRIPPVLAPEGDLTGTFTYGSSGWQGSLATSLKQDTGDNTKITLEDATLQMGEPRLPAQGKKKAVAPSQSSAAPSPGLTLEPAPFHLSKVSQTTLGANFTRSGYSFHLTGTAAPSRLAIFKDLLPPAADNLTTLFPTPPPTAPQHLDITCSSDWGKEQTCSAAVEKPAPRRRTRSR